MNFVLSRQAESAFGKLWDYYAGNGGTRLADRILGQMHDAIQRLIDQPTLGHFRPDLTDKPLRFYRVYNVFLIYDPASSPLYVARVYHTSQDIASRMKREAD